MLETEECTLSILLQTYLTPARQTCYGLTSTYSRINFLSRLLRVISLNSVLNCNLRLNWDSINSTNYDRITVTLFDY